MDEFDRAAQLEQEERQRIISHHQQRQQLPPLYREGEPCCRECGVSIRERLAVNDNACRCIECQQWHERKENRYAR